MPKISSKTKIYNDFWGFDDHSLDYLSPGLLDHREGFVELRLGDDQWWREADDVPLGRLGNQTVLH